MRRWRRRSGLLFFAAIASSMAIPASASAAVTIGNNLSGTPVAAFLSCAPSGCTVANTALAPASTAPGGLVAPSDGVVTEWRIRVGSPTSVMTPRVIRTVSGVMRTGVATGSPVTPPVNQTSSFDTRMPIKAGQYFAVDQAATTAYMRSGVPGSSIQFWGPPLVNGGPAMSGVTNAGVELLVNADIEPDVDLDGYGDETQDLCPNEVTIQASCTRTLTVTAETGGKVTAPGIDCPGDCSEVYANKSVIDVTSTADKGFAIADLGSTPNACIGGPRTLSKQTCQIAISADTTLSADYGNIREPNTTLTKGPKKKSANRKVKFKFKSNEKGSTFQCALDRKHFKRNDFCRSPFKAKVKAGKHVFMVRAIDPGDLADPSPAKVKFKVVG